ncbi:MAG TPA: hypothetical protein VMZ52_10370 [Bryobacteraceae bacterium]|nr:hypothetical protein [Bryobacteraceae bacterium]
MKVAGPEQAHELAREEIDRLVHSDLFRASDAQRRLLTYLAEKSLAGQADDLKEYTVGIEAMGKPSEYDPQRDSSVRMQAARLRDKLAEFYRNEGSGHAVHVEFPKGRFKLIFEPRPVSAPPTDTPLRARHPRQPRMWWIAGMAAAVVLWVGVSLLPRGWLAGASSQSAVDLLWQPFLKGTRPVLLSLGAPLFIQVDGLGFLRAPGIDDWAAAQRNGQLGAIARLFPGKHLESSHVYTGIGEATGAFQLASLFGSRGRDLRLVASETLSWDEIGRSDVIFVGPPKFNLQLKEIPVQQDIELDANGIRNLHPRANEPRYIPDEDAPQPVTSRLAQTHAIITRIPGLHGEGDVLVCASNWTAGTLAAIDYLTREDHARDLVNHIRLPTGKLPRYYQVVIRAKVKGYTPLEVAYVFHHELKTSR